MFQVLQCSETAVVSFFLFFSWRSLRRQKGSESQSSSWRLYWYPPFDIVVQLVRTPGRPSLCGVPV